MSYFTDSELMALADLVANELRRADHTEVYYDVARGIETTPERLLFRLLNACEATPRLGHVLRYRQLGGHVHCRVFSRHGAKHGELVFDAREWPSVREALACVLHVLPEDTP